MATGITIVGLGPGDPSLLTREAWQVLSKAEEIYLRTGDHPVVEHLPSGLALQTFDSLYMELDDFEVVYSAIVAKLLDLANRPDGGVYAVPGDPTVGEATVKTLHQTAAEGGEKEIQNWILLFTDKALEVEPDMAAAYFLRAWAIYIVDKNDPRVMKSLRKAVVLNPKESFYSENLLYLLGDG